MLALAAAALALTAPLAARAPTRVAAVRMGVENMYCPHCALPARRREGGRIVMLPEGWPNARWEGPPVFAR